MFKNPDFAALVPGVGIADQPDGARPRPGACHHDRRGEGGAPQTVSGERLRLGDWLKGWDRRRK